MPFETFASQQWHFIFAYILTKICPHTSLADISINIGIGGIFTGLYKLIHFFKHVKLYYHLSTAVPYLPIITATIIGKTSCFLFRVPTLRAARAVGLFQEDSGGQHDRCSGGALCTHWEIPNLHTQKIPPTIPALSLTQCNDTNMSPSVTDSPFSHYFSFIR